MTTASRVRRLFPGTNTPQGYYSYHRYVMPPEGATRVFLLKGGPGVGKSTLMKRLGKEAEARGLDVEYHHCSADPASLDAVVVPALGVAMMDGTHPHAIDPTLPGALDEIVNLGEYWDDLALTKRREEIAALTRASSRTYQRAYRFLAASRLVYDDIEAIHAERADQGRLNQMAQELLDTFVPPRPASPTPGTIRRMFAGAITSEGSIHHLDTVVGGVRRKVVVTGPPGSGRSTILQKLVQAAVERGFSVECFHCPFAPEVVEHVVIAELDLAVTTSAPPHVWYGEYERRFDTEEALAPMDTKTLHIAKEAEDQSFRLFRMAVASLREAKSLHEEMERIYTPHMDFSRMESLSERLIRKAFAAF